MCSAMVDAFQAKALKAVVEKLKGDPTMFEAPEMAFFKDLALSWGAAIPKVAESKPKEESKPTEDPKPKEEPKFKEEPKPKDEAKPKEEPKVEEPKQEESEEEEEPPESEEDDPERLPADLKPFPAMAPLGELELSDEQLDKQGEAKQVAVEALEDGNMQKALDKYTEAIGIGNATAMMYAKRAEILLKLKRPCACIADCDAALGVNPDSGKAYRIRGKAHRRLGHWEEAHKDLSTGQKLDFADDAVDMQKFVAEKYKRIEERKVRLRLRDERRKVKEMKR